MDGAIDIKLILTVGGVIFSVAGASAVAKMQIKILADECRALNKLISGLDARCDKLHTMTETQEQRLNILAKMSSPENLRRDHISTARFQAEITERVTQLRKEMDHQLAIHNGKHIPVSDVRKAE